jgi:hypothetical protein
MVFTFTFFGGYANPTKELDANETINKRAKIDLREEILFIGLVLFF